MLHAVYRFFDPYQILFYKGKKIIPENIKSFLKNPLALAIWYMDDGYLRTDKSGAYICTSSFTVAEHKLLQTTLWKNYGVRTNVHLAGGYARLHIPSAYKYLFMRIISPFMLPCMQYKLL